MLLFAAALAGCSGGPTAPSGPTLRIDAPASVQGGARDAQRVFTCDIPFTLTAVNADVAIAALTLEIYFEPVQATPSLIGKYNDAAIERIYGHTLTAGVSRTYIYQYGASVGGTTRILVEWTAGAVRGTATASAKCVAP